MRLLVRLSTVCLSGALVFASGCSKSTEAPVATTIVVAPVGGVTFASLTQTQQLSAAVLNQHGDTMLGQSITWASSNTAAARVSTSGLVTAVANGSATVTATSGGAHLDVAVTVAQVASSISKVGGDLQIGTVGQALAIPLTARVRDALGNAMAGVAVTFAVTSGGGTMAVATVNTNATGDAASTWTVGTSVVASNAASASAGGLTTGFTASAVAGAVSAVVLQAGNNQTGAIGQPVAIKPSAKATDSFGNPKAVVTIVFAPASGGGSVSGGTQITDAGGIATVGNWTLGGSAGPNTLTATVQGTAVAVTFSATAVTAGAPTTVAVILGNNQNALAGYQTNIRPAVLVTDAGGLPAPNVSVTFAVASGGGSLGTATVNTNSAGVAQVGGGWTVGAVPGPNSLTATVSGGGIAGNPITFNATGVVSTFQVTIQNVGPAFNSAVQSAFDSALAFWQRAIIVDVADIASFSAGAGTCGAGSPAISGILVDDVVILARFDSIDGPGQVLGSAGPCFIRNSVDAPLTVLGTMRFDTADVAGLVAAGTLNSVIRHEMGHVLGFGTLWNQPPLSCRQNTSGGSPLDTYFSCLKAVAAFDSIGGTSYTGGFKVPVENCGPASPAGCGAGTVNSHWREPTFFNEMMTGYLNNGVNNPASLLTIAAMEDLGYKVNYGAAEPYTRVFTVGPSMRAAEASAAGTAMHDDVYRGPIYGVDANGRVVGVVARP